jgi:hypothetical protein
MGDEVKFDGALQMLLCLTNFEDHGFMPPFAFNVGIKY